VAALPRRAACPGGRRLGDPTDDAGQRYLPGFEPDPACAAAGAVPVGVRVRLTLFQHRGRDAEILRVSGAAAHRSDACDGGGAYRLRSRRISDAADRAVFAGRRVSAFQSAYRAGVQGDHRGDGRAGRGRLVQRISTIDYKYHGGCHVEA